MSSSSSIVYNKPDLDDDNMVWKRKTWTDPDSSSPVTKLVKLDGDDTPMEPPEKIKSVSFFKFKVMINYILADMKRKPFSYRIGIFTVVMVLVFVMLVWSAIGFSDLIFMKLS